LWRARSGASTILIETQHGLGDNVFAAVVVAAMARDARFSGRLAVKTPWPQLYVGTASPVECDSGLRTQKANLRRMNLGRHSARALRVHVGYGRNISPARERKATLLQCVEASAGVVVDDFRLPEQVVALGDVGRLDRLGVRSPYVLVHYPTRRREWDCPARNPEPGAIAAAVRAVARPGSDVVSLAWVDPPHEVFVDADMPASVRLESGEASLEDMIALVAGAEVVVTTVGFLLVLACAMRAPLVVVFGGHMAPDVIMDPRMTSSGLVHVVAPDPFCHCVNNHHDCRKALPAGWADRLATWYDDVRRGLAGGNPTLLSPSARGSAPPSEATKHEPAP